MADEKIIQIESDFDGYTLALTNQGRLFAAKGNSDCLYWKELELPDLKKSKPRQAKESGYSEEFLDFWSVYPKGHGGSKKEAANQWEKRLSEVEHIERPDEFDSIFKGLNRYIKFIEATGQHIKHPATFLGPNKHYLNDFTIPDSVVKKNRVKQEWEKIPDNDNHLIGFIEKHGFKKGDRMETAFDTRNRLRSEIRARILAEDE